MQQSQESTLSAIVRELRAVKAAAAANIERVDNELAAAINAPPDDGKESDASTLALERQARVEAERRFAETLTQALAERDAQLNLLQYEADARLAALNETTLAAQTFEAEYRNASATHADLQSALVEAQAHVDSLRSQVEILQAACDERLKVIEQLQRVADERLELINKLQIEIGDLRAGRRSRA